MNHSASSIFLLGFFFLCTVAAAQPKRYTTAQAHAHNDYLNERPFYLAFENGFGSIEADIFPVDGVLYVAHTKREIQARNTLKDLYLAPLLQAFAAGKARKLNLLIDIKENHAVALPLLIRELEPLMPYLYTLERPNLLTITITGNRPRPADYRNYPDFIFFDDDLKLPHTESEWRRVALVSLPLNRLSAWKGEGNPARKDRKTIRRLIDSVHRAGKPIRFWAAPDHETSWRWQMKRKADLIGTDQVRALGALLRKETGDRRTRRDRR